MHNRFMAFFDGSNFLVELAKEIRVEFRADKPPASTFKCASQILTQYLQYRPLHVIRKYWFGSYVGDEKAEKEYRSQLRNFGFEPVLFRRRNGREKGVDIALTKEMLVNAFNQNFDYSVLLAGDEDYVGLVQETKRYGQIIGGAFFERGLSDSLRVTFDSFESLSSGKFADPLGDLKTALEQQ